MCTYIYGCKHTQVIVPTNKSKKVISTNVSLIVSVVFSVRVVYIYTPHKIYTLCVYIFCTLSQIVVYKNAPKDDLNSAELSVKAKVRKLKVTVLFRFLNRIKVHCEKLV